MVRTRADNTGRRAVAAKAPRKQLGSSSSSAGGSAGCSPGGKDKNCGGNPVRWTPTPSWQKGIGTFFNKMEEEAKEDPTIPEEESTPSQKDGDAIEETPTTESNSKQCSSNLDEITSLEDSGKKD